MPLAVPLATRTQRLPDEASSLADGYGSNVAQHARTAAAEALDRGETHYTDRPGIGQLRSQVALRLSGATGVDITASDTVVTCGVTEARFVPIQQLATPTSTVVALGHRDRLEGACMIRGVSLQSPQEPWGEESILYIPEDAAGDELTSSLARAKEVGCAIVMELDLASGTAPFQPTAHGLADQTVVIGDAAGPFGAAAWRVGFLAAPAVHVAPLRDFKQALTICTTAVSQWGTLALLEESA